MGVVVVVVGSTSRRCATQSQGTATSTLTTTNRDGCWGVGCSTIVVECAVVVVVRGMAGTLRAVLLRLVVVVRRLVLWLFGFVPCGMARQRR